jgi:hypothetical protein
MRAHPDTSLKTLRLVLVDGPLVALCQSSGRKA